MKKSKIYLTLVILCLPLPYCPFTIYANQVLNEIHSSFDSNQEMMQVNINTASAEELAKNLTGIGLNKANRIVEYRDKFGPFIAIEQLKEVSGIGQSILDKNIGRIQL